MASGVQVAFFTVLNSTLYSSNRIFSLYFLSQMLERSMDLHVCAFKYMKSCFLKSKHAANQENDASRYCIVLKS